MASVCGGCLAMMLAGVPLIQPIAGIAMGLVQGGDQAAILSDIQGSEDPGGDMDFKVVGAGIGITALQMGIKVKGVSRELLEAELGQALGGRCHILRKMLDVEGAPSADISEHSPRFESIKIPGEKIGFLIGTGGLCFLPWAIKALQADYEVKVARMGDDGNIQVFGTNSTGTRHQGQGHRRRDPRDVRDPQGRHSLHRHRQVDPRLRRVHRDPARRLRPVPHLRAG